MKKEINYICPLGTVAHPASWVKRMNLYKSSYPFDWIFSNIKMVVDCINDDFKKFLDRNNHIPSIKPKHKEKKNKSGHKIYGGSIFNHHNILDDEDYNYYIRCVQRFRTLITKEENKLFMLSIENMKNDRIQKSFKNKLFKLYNTLKSITKNFDLLCVYHIIGDKTDFEIVDFKDYPDFKIMKITTKHSSKGVRIRDRFENKFWDKTVYNLYNFKLLDDIK